MTDIRLTDDQLDTLAAKIAAASHTCRFNDGQAKRIHAIADMAEGEGIKDLQALFALGRFVRTGNVALTWAAASLIVGAVGVVLWNGYKALLGKG